MAFEPATPAYMDLVTSCQSIPYPQDSLSVSYDVPSTLGLMIKVPYKDEQYFCFNCDRQIQHEMDCFCDEVCYDTYLDDMRNGARVPDFACAQCKTWMDPLEAKWSIFCSFCEEERRVETPTYDSDDWSSDEELYTPAEQFMMNPFSRPLNVDAKEMVVSIVKEFLVLIQDAKGKALKAKYSYFFFLYISAQGTCLMPHKKLRATLKEKIDEWRQDDFVMTLYDFDTVFKKLETMLVEAEKED